MSLGLAPQPGHTKRPPRLGLLGLLAVACASPGAGPDGAPAPPLPPQDPALVSFAPELGLDLRDFERRPSGLYVRDLEVGDGPAARRDSRVWVHYVGWLPDATVFDASLGGPPYHVRLGGSEVIRGWNEGIVGMRRGGQRLLVVPPGLAYGSRGRGSVPPGATLIFRLELIEVD